MRLEACEKERLSGHVGHIPRNLGLERLLDCDAAPVHRVEHLSAAPQIHPFGAPLDIVHLRQLAADDDDRGHADEQAGRQRVLGNFKMESLARPFRIKLRDLEHGDAERSPAEQTGVTLPALQDRRIGQSSQPRSHGGLKIGPDGHQSTAERDQGAKQKRFPVFSRTQVVGRGPGSQDHEKHSPCEEAWIELRFHSAAAPLQRRRKTSEIRNWRICTLASSE